MDIKVLYVIAVASAAVSGGYFYYSGKGKKLDVNSAQSMNYSAEGIQLIQTDEQGNLYVRAQVDHLQQDLNNKTSKLTNLNASMFHQNQVDSTFFAQKVDGSNDNEKVILSGQVKATKIGENGTIVFLSDELTGYPQKRMFETTHQVTVNTPDAEFVSQGLKADFNQGQYEFAHIRGKYVPN